MSKPTVTINGTIYDAHTGLPIDDISSAQTASSPTPTMPAAKVQPSSAVHQRMQKSQTLTRRLVQKAAAPTVPPAAPSQDIRKSPMVTKFAPSQAPTRRARPAINDIGPVAHPVVTKIRKQQAASNIQPAAPKPSHIIKQEAIDEALQKAPTKHQAEKASKRQSGRLRKFMSVGSVSLALLLLAGYFTYINMPNLSVRVAAAQAGVDASYPEYRPDGYGLSGSVAYNQGWVSMKFASNSGTHNFTIKQSKSSWDSSAVLDNHVKEKAGDSYISYNERGLTIYIYSSNAAWVNDGIFYTIEGDAPLSSDQIRRIATSM